MAIFFHNTDGETQQWVDAFSEYLPDMPLYLYPHNRAEEIHVLLRHTDQCMTYGFVTRSGVPPVVRAAVREEGGNVAAVINQLFVRTQAWKLRMRVFARIILVLPLPRDTGGVQ